jgi:hypothetical protein
MEPKLIFRIHALRRMFERHISVDDISEILRLGEIIESYPGDLPYGCRLVLGWRGYRPLHVVVADNFDDNESIVITAYEPDPEQWQPDFKRRKL